jgi:hypothetical protein
MCGAGENRQWSISASLRVRFSKLAARRITPVAPLTALKCFHPRRISRCIRLRNAAPGLSASIAEVFRSARASRGRQLPSVRRNVPEVRRKTPPAPGTLPGMGLKPFN